MTFVDSSGRFALVVPVDPDHEAATRWIEQNQQPLLTTDYVIDETLTLLRARRQGRLVASLGARLFGGELAAIHFLAEDEIRAGWDVYRRFDDKQWSFTDCTSKVMIETFRIAEAFSFDHHFRQFGSVRVVP